ncbi:MAG: phosphoadenosine phosphosulfate reductase [Lentisphaerae bacterium GWF2_52_8]|nr:MAG: phosphoadenosine phosphosulfate reductase [Lentisphaerae bacterium GWF2_52_8]
MTVTDALELQARWHGVQPQKMLAHFLQEYRGKIALASSLGAEDMVLTDIIFALAPTTKIFTLDTGRLFQETYELIEEIRSRYGIAVQAYFPEASELEEIINRHGPNLFYQSVEKRKLCCRIRKLNPLKRALAGLEVWVTGLRHEQSDERAAVELVEWDEAHGLLKLNPLASWSTDDVWRYIREHKLPYHKLHDKGYPSIGCACCTRCLLPGESFRAGRWYWEEAAAPKECGLHLVDGKLRRASLEKTHA